MLNGQISSCPRWREPLRKHSTPATSLSADALGVLDEHLEAGKLPPSMLERYVQLSRMARNWRTPCPWVKKLDPCCVHAGAAKLTAICMHNIYGKHRGSLHPVVARSAVSFGPARLEQGWSLGRGGFGMRGFASSARAIVRPIALHRPARRADAVLRQYRRRMSDRGQMVDTWGRSLLRTGWRRDAYFRRAPAIAACWSLS